MRESKMNDRPMEVWHVVHGPAKEGDVKIFGAYKDETQAAEMMDKQIVNGNSCRVSKQLRRADVF